MINKWKLADGFMSHVVFPLCCLALLGYSLLWASVGLSQLADSGDVDWLKESMIFDTFGGLSILVFFIGSFFLVLVFKYWLQSSKVAKPIYSRWIWNLFLVKSLVYVLLWIINGYSPMTFRVMVGWPAIWAFFPYYAHLLVREMSAGNKFDFPFWKMLIIIVPDVIIYALPVSFGVGYKEDEIRNFLMSMPYPDSLHVFGNMIVTLLLYWLYLGKLLPTLVIKMDNYVPQYRPEWLKWVLLLTTPFGVLMGGAFFVFI